ncbi:hypothetical protein [Sphingomonas desiccabilis]|uniref:Tetratricopeptide repeat protein n=1 Tax=Sphingomonas desiccabilis TaxID=429134 RepID=A0A4Q2IR60_9SPHN|nr:hypothetical protein [Sphingomonas desiccabilis]MBB3911072.1 hypothetical protein [Sphingomonas desiccabilis]RXZ32113.1 hypothetical protein EO081_13140 [Sphingomonas desiccabilis]
MNAQAILTRLGAVPLALACFASAAERTGMPVGMLPAGLAPGASIQAAREAFVSADPMRARARAAAAVAASPMDAGASALLGAVALKAGDPVAAHDAFAVSARLGWRNPAAQLYWLGAGLEAQDHRLAAERLDALLRTGQRSAATDAALLQLEASPAGRSAVAAQLLAAPDWRSAFVASIGTLSGTPLARRIAVLQRARSGGMPLDCEAIAAVARSQFARGTPASASAPWRATCAPAGETQGRDRPVETTTDAARRDARANAMEQTTTS